MGMLYEHNEELETTEKAPSAFELWWESEPVGARFVLHEPAQDIAEKGWNAAREAAATKMEARGCLGPSLCGGILHHDHRCPVALAAKIREEL